MAKIREGYLRCLEEEKQLILECQKPYECLLTMELVGETSVLMTSVERYAG